MRKRCEKSNKYYVTVKEKMGQGKKERGGGVNKGRNSMRQLMRREERRLSRVSDERARRASSINDEVNG